MRDAIFPRRPPWVGIHFSPPGARPVTAALRAVARRLHRAWLARQAREAALRLHLALRDLDERDLRDLGVERGESGSTVAGLGDRAALDRMRAMQAA